MKKNIFKKTLVAFTAALMMAATTIPASAADYTITIDNDCPDHTYQAYQIFAGTLDGDTLSNITWGTGITDEGKTALGDAAAKAATLAADIDAAKAFAKLVAPYLSTTYVEDDYDDDSYALTVSDAGYYLIIDKPESLNNTDESYTSYILEVVKDVTTSPKSEVPTVEKKVQDKNDTANTTSDWQDSADYDIGDTVPFEITVTLPNNYEDYTNYSLVITDTLSDGLDFTDNSVKVFIGNTELYPGYYCNDGVLTIDLTSALANATADVNSSEIKITYTATLNENAVIGGAGNPNTVSATYSNNPNSDMDGSTDDTGTTPEDKVVVFTYNAIIDKRQVDKLNDSQGQFLNLFDTSFKRSYDPYQKHLLVILNRIEFNTRWLLKQQDIFMQHLKVPQTKDDLNVSFLNHPITDVAQDLVLKDIRSMSSKKKELEDE